jgi:hypothetical protein
MVRFALAAAFVFMISATVSAQEMRPLALESSSLHQATPKRPAALMPLYLSFGALQLIDVHSTSRALRSGAVEANPIMKPFAGSSASLITVKAAGAAVAIFASESLWKRNRAAAIAFMVAANSGMAWVAQHNYRAVR